MANTSHQTSLKQAGLTPQERKALGVMRYLFQTYATPHRHNWMTALDLSQRMFEPSHSASTFAACVDVVDEMRRARVSGFKFTNPDCAYCSQFLSDHERLFMGAVSALRLGQTSALHANAMLLCEGNDPSGFLKAARTLADVLSSADASFAASA